MQRTSLLTLTIGLICVGGRLHAQDYPVLDRIAGDPLSA